MKKNYLFTALLALPILSFFLVSNSGGFTSGASGSPGDGGNTCSGCHSGGNFNAVPTIVTNIPDTGYELGKTYNVTVSVASSSIRHGFQITAEDAKETKVGGFQAGDGSRSILSSKSLTHTSAGTAQKSWTFFWTAPSVDKGDITFYVAVNATNASGGTSGDQVVTVNKKVGVSTTLGVSDFESDGFAIYPNPASDVMTIDLANETQAEVKFFDFTGKVVKSTSVNSSKNTIDVSDLSSGIYHVSVKTAKGTVTKSIAIK